jgi:hypothetical protein
MSDDWWIERQQNKRLKGLEEDLGYVSASLSSARASQNRLKAELSKVSGSMEQRLNRLTAAFDAFVEISDLRVTLGLFDEHGRVRHQAKQLLAGTALGDVADAEGYWLAPALVALRGVGENVVDADALSLADARDPHRTAVWHVLLTSVLGGRSTVPAVSLERALPVFAATMPHYQRAVWLLAADGFFGAAGWELARQRCADFVDAEQPGLGAMDLPKAVVAVSKELDNAPALAVPLQACGNLTALRTWVSEAVDGYTGEPAVATDPLAKQSLELLIGEGSPIELPLLARERELRAVIEGKTTASSTWDSAEGQTIDLLRADATDAEHPNRRALAVRATAPLLLSKAEEYATAARATAPESLSVRTRYGQVTITPTSPDRASLDRALGIAERSSQVESQRRTVAYVAGGLTVVFVVLAIVAGWGWVFAALVAGGVAAFQWLTDKKERAAAAEEAERSKTALRTDVDQRVTAFADARKDLAARQTTVEEDLKALHAALA